MLPPCRSTMPRQHGVDAVDGAPQVDLHLPLPFLARFLQEQAVDGPPGVVDQHVHAAELGGGRLDHHVDRFVAGDVGSHHHRPAACVQSVDFISDSLALRLVQFRDDDVAAFVGEGVDDGSPDVGAAASDDDRLA